MKTNSIDYDGLVSALDKLQEEKDLEKRNPCYNCIYAKTNQHLCDNDHCPYFINN